MQYLDITQVTSVLRSAYKASRRDHLILLLSFQHGLRASEVAALRVQDVQDGLIRVARLKGSLETAQPLMGSKNVVFDESRALAAWLEERPKGSDALFPSTTARRTIGRIAKQYMLAVGVPAELAHHHSLKHALASMMIRSGVDLAYVKQALGHRSISSTIMYTHIQDSEATAKASAAIQNALGE
jgi:site-specific recombinase XerD